MGDKTGIGWTDATWNVATGCTRVSPGCDHCYMFRDWPRLHAMGVPGYEGQPDQVALHEGRLNIPLKWKRPRLIFVCSTGDLFHSEVPFAFLDSVFNTMHAASQHTFQVLTKRPGRMLQFVRWRERTYPGISPSVLWPDNVWAGTSLEQEWDGRRRLTARLDVLAEVPARVRFVSYEPALGPVDFGPWLPKYMAPISLGHIYAGERGRRIQDGIIDWVIAGCESGSRARPSDPDWFRSVRDQCQAAGVPFFLKQMVINGKKTTQPELDNRQWTEFPNGNPRS